MSSLMNLYKEHDAAIKYLERAVQISPDYVYAQTLLGLENTLIKNYDKALLGFQSATSIDPRHFNAWYIHSHTCTCTHTFTYMYMYIYIHIHVHVHIHSHTCTCTYTLTHVYVHVHIHSHT